MQAVILAAGKSTRTYPLTKTRPKPLLKAANKTIIEHNLSQLDGIVDEAVIVVNYLSDQIKEKIGDKFENIDIKYIKQKEPLGTGHAVMSAKNMLKDKFIVMNGDDFFSNEDIKRCTEHEFCVLVKKVSNPENFGVIVQKNNILKKIVEKPKIRISDLANTGLYVFTKEIFKKKLTKSKRGEYEITDYLKYLVEAKKVNVKTVEDYWFPIVYPWDLLGANSFFIKNIKETKNLGLIEDNTTIMGNIIVGKNTKILNGVYIEGNIVIGENCKIGPNCYLRRNTAIGNNCHIGQAVEIKNSIIMDNSNVPHLSYIGDSVIGEKVNLGAGTITANLRHDNKNVKSMVKKKLVDTKRRKLGAIIADYVHTGINTSIYPGRKFWPHATTLPGQAVKKDIR
ncbi:NTP transferase domain-containing protein [Candidatus Woesearchaeota archaeon]|nr:NTP transferase domain-containing protein [Candidatus Woesearchaeota archaeon]